ncbi:hypothetical protein BJF83_17825 [Nocardiopsis sp. CNR-923]|uniref:hypothetical protein n=1 Tax=Nocardiopsis sp. CNR-923 TaxID=1904965 RepID=UPI0009635190|nr:hypothetical protein [Nocardiopsis sp. CNR-923]OLT27712.1 hypothetical protein BJF83_17825 [Nocardiopsis sp. CNR-923]
MPSASTLRRLLMAGAISATAVLTMAACNDTASDGSSVESEEMEEGAEDEMSDGMEDDSMDDEMTDEMEGDSMEEDMSDEMEGDSMDDEMTDEMEDDMDGEN